jgi:rhodanese-related sulfurtransferase
LTGRIAQWLGCQGYELAAVLDTHSHGDHASSAPELLSALQREPGEVDGLGWPLGHEAIRLGALKLTRLAVPGHTRDSTAYLLHDAQGLRLAFVGDTVMPGALGRSDFEQSAPLDYGASLRRLAEAVGPQTLLLPGHDYEDRFASTLAVECAAQPLLDQVLSGRLADEGFASAKAELERDLALTRYQTVACGARVDGGGECASNPLSPAELRQLSSEPGGVVLVDVREPYEQRLGHAPELGAGLRREAVALSGLPNAIGGWLSLPAETTVVFFCRSGNRSAQAARALRRLGHERAWSLAGGLALWPRQSTAPDAAFAI